MSATRVEAILDVLATRLSAVEDQHARLRGEVAALSVRQPARGRENAQVHSAVPMEERGAAGQRASRRGMLRAALGVAAATVGAAALLETQTGEALATGKEGPTTFTSTTTVPAVAAYNIGGVAVYATSSSSAASLLATNSGAGAAIYASTTSSTANTISAVNAGKGSAVYASNSGAGTAITASSTGSGNAITASSTSSGADAIAVNGQWNHGIHVQGQGNVGVQIDGNYVVGLELGSNTLQGTVHDRGGAVFNVKAYGAVGNGAADDTAALQATINAAQHAGGGVVYVPQGTYVITASLTISRSGVNLLGAGQTATIIEAATTYANGDVILFSSVSACSARMLTIAAPAQRQGGAAMHISNSDEIYIQDVDMNNMFYGCVIDGAQGILHYIDRGYWTNFTQGGIGIWINITNGNGNDQYISNIVMDDNLPNHGDPATQPLAGIRIQNSQAVWMRSCDILHAQSGLLIDPPGGGLVTWCFFTDCAWDQCGNYGIKIAPLPGARIRGLEFVNCWSSSTLTYDGCYIGGSDANAVDTVQFIGHRFLQNQANGLYVTGPAATQIFLDACAVGGNNPSNNGNSGIVFTESCKNFAVRNCRIGAFAWFGTTQQNGILVTGGCNNYIITGNMMLGNITDINDSGGPNKIVANNLQ